MRNYRIALAVALGILSALPTSAMAHTRHHRRVVAQLIFHHPARAARPRGTLATTMAIGMGDVQSLGCVNLPLADSGFVRIVAGFNDNPDRELPCAEAARASGLGVLLVIQWANDWTDAEVHARFARVLSDYRDVRPFAVAIGNEQEGPWNAGHGESPAQYAAYWRTLEPMVARAFPSAIRVAGEISPWGDGWLNLTANLNLHGVQAYACHAYPAAGAGGYGSAERCAQIAHQHGVQAWADEGLCGPGAWQDYRCTTASRLRRDGFNLAAEWYVTSPAPIPPSAVNSPTPPPNAPA